MQNYETSTQNEIFSILAKELNVSKELLLEIYNSQIRAIHKDMSDFYSKTKATKTQLYDLDYRELPQYKLPGFMKVYPNIKTIRKDLIMGQRRGIEDVNKKVPLRYEAKLKDAEK